MPLDHENPKTSLIWSNQQTMNSVALVPSVIVCPQMLQRLLSLRFFLSRLDYCISLLSGCPQYLLHKLQKVQNNAARLVLRVSKTDHISLHVSALYWLPIDSRIVHTLFSLLYLPQLDCFCLPDCLLRINKPSRQLSLSSDTSMLCRPSIRTHSLGQRSFSYTAPSARNTLR